MLVSGAIVYGTFWFLEGRAVSIDDTVRRYPLAVGRAQEPPAPRLQTQPFKDVYDLKSGQRGVLNRYGWVDKATGVVHIPIERAMELTLQRGLPVREGPASAMTTMVVQDSSAGRTSGAALDRRRLPPCTASRLRHARRRPGADGRGVGLGAAGAPGLRPAPASPANQTPEALQQVRFDQKLDARLPLDATLPRRVRARGAPGRVLRQPAGGAGLRLLRVPDALHPDPQRAGERAGRARADGRAGFRRRRDQLRRARDPGDGGGQEGGLPRHLQAAGRRAGLALPHRRRGQHPPGDRRRRLLGSPGTRRRSSSRMPAA